VSAPDGSGIEVRPAGPSDLGTIVRFNAGLAQETEGKQLDPTVLERGVTRALAEPDRLRYWVAERQGLVVGQAAITREWSDWRDGWIWWLQSVYVDAPDRGKGVFRALITAIRDAALTAGDVIGLRLYVEDANHDAQKVYRALDFEPGGYQVFEQFWIEPLIRPARG
jgi:GNAT superfamily N-acetyltransferase